MHDSAKSIRNCKELLKQPTLYEDLKFIKTYFSNLPSAIVHLQSQKLQLSESIACFNKVIADVSRVPGEFGCRLKEYIGKLKNKNPGYNALSEINNLQNSTLYKFAPVTSCDVERSFSLCRDILTPKRTNLTSDNLEKLLVIYFNSRK